MTQKQRNLPDSRHMAALAYRDAIRDILGDEGVFTLAHHRAPDVVWEFDGHAWRRVDLTELDEAEYRGAARIVAQREAELPL